MEYMPDTKNIALCKSKKKNQETNIMNDFDLDQCPERVSGSLRLIQPGQMIEIVHIMQRI